MERLDKTNTTSCKGATILEFALIAPVFLLMVFGFIELSRYLTVKGILDSAALDALTVATRVPGLDMEDSDERFVDAKELVITKAKQLPLNTFVTDEDQPSLAYLTSEPEITVPRRQGEPRSQTLDREPITIEIRARLRPIFSFIPEIDITSRATGYREQQLSTSAPQPTDCLGRPQDDPGYFENCPCDPNAIWNPDTRACECEPPLEVVNDICACPDGRVFNPTTRECVCPDSCGILNNATLNEETCECVCDKPDQTFVNGKCECNSSCPESFVQDPIDCSCYCPANTVLENGACVCSPGRIEEDGQCVCDSSICRPDQVQNSYCYCQCPSGMEEQEGICACPEGTTEQNGDCVCDENPCRADQIQNNDCSCSCPEGASEIDGVCQCPENYAPQGGECVCDLECASGYQLDQSACACICNPPRQIINGFCVPSWCNLNCNISPEGDCVCPE